jgi:hypothetical protein
MALHRDRSRTYVGKLEAEGVNQRQGDGFPPDQNRVAYLRYLRRDAVASDLLVLRRPRSPRRQQDDGEHNHAEIDSATAF